MGAKTGSQAFHGGRLLDAEREFGLPGDQFIDFSSNLNVLAPSISATEWGSWVLQARRYPEADSETLRRRLGEFYGVAPGCILPTAGAIESLYLAARLFEGRKVAIIEPGFGDYGRSFATVRCTCAQVVLPPEMWYEPAEKWADLLAPFDVAVFGNPNNPTGSFHRKDDLVRLMSRGWARPKSWMIDESFLEFVENAENETLFSVLQEFPSLIVLRSLTKSWGIPGLRLGFLATFGSTDRLRRMQAPWSVNSIAEAWSRSFLTAARRAELALSFEALRLEKERFARRLSEIPGIRLHRGAANFLLLELVSESLEAGNLYGDLGRRGLLVRVCDSFRGMTAGRFIRVAVRSAFENDRLAQELSELCDEKIRRVA